jgi:carbon storage regulator CsrA
MPGMLVLARKIGERIYIGDDGDFIEIRKVAGNRVTIACKFPGHVKVLRGELRDGIEAGEKKPGTLTEQAHDVDWEAWANEQKDEGGKP